jgi:hypothetical protein
MNIRIVDDIITEKLTNDNIYNYDHIDNLINMISNINDIDEYNELLETLKNDKLFQNEKYDMKYNGDDLYFDKIVLISSLEYKKEALRRIEKYNYSEELMNNENIKKIEMIKKYKKENLNDILNKLSRLKHINNKMNDEIYKILNEYLDSDSEFLLLDEYNFNLINNYVEEVYEKPLNNNKRTFMIKNEYEFIKNVIKKIIV